MTIEHTSPAGAMRRPSTNRRWWIGALLALGVLVNYFDRVNLTVASPLIQDDFKIGPAEMGILFSAFGWTYGFLQIPVGMLLDRFGVMRVMRWSTFSWGIASVITAFSTGMQTLFLSRMLLGVAETPGFPANSKATGYWFPRHERGLATALFDAAAKFSNVIAIPMVAFLMLHFGWRGGFIATAIISFVFFALFWLFYRDPSADRNLSDEERAYLKAGGAALEGEASANAVGMLGYLLRNRKVWGLSIGFAAYGYAFALFIFWLPDYLVKEMHMDILKSASFTTIPWIFATISDLLIGGWLIDHLIRKGHDESRVRKTIIVLGMLMGLAVVGAGLTADPYWAILWITISLSGLAAAAPAGWSIPALIAPKGGAATVGGIMNFLNSVTGIAAPIITGFIVGATQSFSRAFLLAGAMLAIGIVSYVFVLGRIEPIADPKA
ncbi:MULTISPECIES: MFS transporter [unclassified Rhizobium]|jgi:ACS family D-galactonate transporter-like MFS transporter|uniref:MFS transporter n=1 Tax=unclassified Rhizobium TaxID=2613769 RepID=UPI0009E06A58|nr:MULTISPECIES: MFS transporter [unclassified Rhizobium]MBN8950789.1 MFS transporter [Rhizobium tropici]RKD69110.1 sugar phosphate permease [Rhizobium sp. WW_1]